LDRLVIALKPGTKSIIATTSFTIQISQPWPSTVLTWKYPGQAIQMHGQITMEVTEIELCPNIIIREDGFMMRWSWKPLIHTVKEW
jgi:hypothetical protein